MPPLRRPEAMQRILLPPRDARVAAQTDVLVAGGGPAGIGAALGAAAAGARVVLVERYGFLGGNATAALVMPLMSFHTQSPGLYTGANKLLPDDHGPGEPVIAGALQALLERLVRAGGAIAPSLETGYVVPFDPEAFKSAALDLLDEAGVEYLLHAFCSGVLSSGGDPNATGASSASAQDLEDSAGSSRTRVEGAVLETKSGPLVVRARAVIDCTGDGDLAAAAGAPYEIGRDEDGLVQPMTLMFRMVRFRKAEFDAYVEANPTQWRGVHGLWDLIREATAAGELDLPREDILFFATPHEEELAINSTRVTRVLGTDVWDLTFAEWAGRQQMRRIAAFLRARVPGFEESYAVQSGVQIGVRETRRILGEYRLTAEDLLCARRFDDGVARGSYPLDIHNPEGKGTVLRRLPPGEAYDIPLRALVPRDVDGILVAGRCLSGTHEAHSSYRVMPVSMATGQAAGVCGALAARAGVPPRAVPAAEVRAELRRQGANLGSA